VSFQVDDGSAANHASNVVTATVGVTSVNDAPLAQDDSVSTDEDTVIAGQTVATDLDNSQAQLTYSVVSQGAHGTVSMNTNGSYTYTPNADYNGNDSFTYKANDGSVDSNTATVNITVNSVNDAPVAGDDSYSTSED